MIEKPWIQTRSTIKRYESLNYKILTGLSPVNHFQRTAVTFCIASRINDFIPLIATDSNSLDSSNPLRKKMIFENGCRKKQLSRSTLQYESSIKSLEKNSINFDL